MFKKYIRILYKEFFAFFQNIRAVPYFKSFLLPPPKTPLQILQLTNFRTHLSPPHLKNLFVILIFSMFGSSDFSALVLTYQESQRIKSLW